jgi:hypothetical protein
LIKVGFVSGWNNDVVLVSITRNYTPSFGDLLYTREIFNGGTRTTVLEVVGLSSETPTTASPVEVQGVLSSLEVKMLVKARLFIEIIETGSSTILVKASRPPSLMTTVYLARRGDLDSEEIMAKISQYSSMSGRGVGAVVLRSGVVHNKLLAKERYFTNAVFKLNLGEIIRKHVLIVGQTGSGKTSGVQGLLVKYALESPDKIGWLVIDRHGEYTPPEGYVVDKFIGAYVDALRSNPYIGGSVKVYTYRLTTTPQKSRQYSTVLGVYDIKEEPVKASSVTFSDFAALEEVGFERATLIEEFLSVVIDALKYLESSNQSSQVHGGARRVVLGDVFVSRDTTSGGDVEHATGNLIALIPILADNFVRYEGIGERREEKKGLHRVLVDRGIDAKYTRIIRRLVLTTMGWRVKTIVSGSRSIVVLDDSRSVIKVSPTLKDPDKLPCLLEELEKAFNGLYKTGSGRYPWKGLCKESRIEVLGDIGIDIGELTRQVDEGNTVILDVSQLSSVQADLVSLTIARRIFERRLEEGVEAVAGKPVVSIVSEEAPLYLSPERVRSPYNSFARIAREGRKFGVGLIAISQMATFIERQLLGNFNTLIVMRTKSSSDLDFFRDIGIPVETLPYLGDREAFIYTPDLPVKEPIPVYLPAWFDEDYAKLIDEKRRVLSGEYPSVKELLED